MHSNLSGSTKAVCYRKVFAVGEFVVRGSAVILCMYISHLHGKQLV